MGAGMDEPVPPREAKEVKEREISGTVAAIGHGGSSCVLVVPEKPSEVVSLPDTGIYKLHVAGSATREFALCGVGSSIGLETTAEGTPYGYLRSHHAIEFAEQGDKLNIKFGAPGSKSEGSIGIENRSLRERLEQFSNSGEKGKAD